MEEILRRIPEFKAAARGMGEIVPADLVLIAEAPAPAGREERRIRVLLERCNETGVRPRAIGNCGSGFGIRLETDGNHRDLSAAGADSLRNQPEGPPGKIDAAAVSGATSLARGMNYLARNNVTMTKVLASIVVVRSFEPAIKASKLILKGWGLRMLTRGHPRFCYKSIANNKWY